MLMKRIVNKIPVDVVNEDAYIGLLASFKNLFVKYCEDAIVYIKAPTNIIDFIHQRRRVAYGHFRVKSYTKHFPRTLESMLMYDLSKTIIIVAKEFKEYPRNIPRFIVATMLDFIANLLAIFDLIFKGENGLRKRFFGFIGDFGKSLRIMNCQIRQDLTIQPHISRLQSVHELAVAQAT